MAQQTIRLWEIASNQELSEVASTEVPLEERLEDWLESDISMLDPDLVVVGRQVRTDFGGLIDLLCIDKVGDAVVIELKKGRTPREVTAQTLDYASWVMRLTREKLAEIAEDYYKSQSLGSLEEVFQDKFGRELPETLNGDHRSIIVAESLDASTKRIIDYLAEREVRLDLITVQHFQAGDGKRMLARVYLVDPEVAAARSRSRSRPTSYRTVSELQAIADENGIGDLYRQVRDGVRGILSAQPYATVVGYCGKRPPEDGGGVRTVMFVGAYPEDGRLAFVLHATRFKAILGIELDALKECLPGDARETERGNPDIADVSTWVGSSEEEKQHAVGMIGWFRSSEEVAKFIDLLRNCAQLKAQEE